MMGMANATGKYSSKSSIDDCGCPCVLKNPRNNTTSANQVKKLDVFITKNPRLVSVKNEENHALHFSIP